MTKVIEARDISKLYRLGEIGTGTISRDINRWWPQVRGKEDPYKKIGERNDRSAIGNSEFVWSLKDINFDVHQGEVLGIIGKNGAGKSTLLKILSRITAPTTGSIKTRGRIASLLEVGTGFHPDLTGRENIYLNGAIMGMRKAEVKKKFDAIVDFSGVARYVDTPVKRYSSGMYVRLAFAVAAHLEPEILVVDEVLAVGDAEFQKKCLGKMKDVTENEGRTVLFVSHNMTAIKSLCTSGLLLEKGNINFVGNIDESIGKYIQADNKSNSFKWDIENDTQLINSTAHFVNVSIVAKNNKPITTNDEVEIKIKAKIIETGKYFFELHLVTINDEIIFISTSETMEIDSGEYLMSVYIPSDFLNNSTYKINLSIVKDQKYVINRLKDSLFIEILDGQRNIEWYGKWDGYIRPQLKWLLKT